ncbi:hypothetical protein GUJ93_ZPchr0006g46156 [Zizania palustris]|uniref:Uncharacterized protein n=1 Tax=Zizania palustris TaxID=103762 RepID=A0A8J5SF74_ZIZPA|nr:hypothetical protein GUJ93_ZPchr0006g46156 [Zizania palustris]
MMLPVSCRVSYEISQSPPHLPPLPSSLSTRRPSPSPRRLLLLERPASRCRGTRVDVLLSVANPRHSAASSRGRPASRFGARGDAAGLVSPDYISGSDRIEEDQPSCLEPTVT